MKYMKWTTLVLVIVIMACGSALGAGLNLRATWTKNEELDMKEYRLYRTDGTRTLIGTISQSATLPYPFSVTVPDQSSGTLTFVLTAVDQNNNESLDSNLASFSYHTISGYVRTGTGTGISGVVMGGLPNNPATDSAGGYSSPVSSGWSGTVTPSKSGYTFSPTSRSYNNVTSNQTGQDYTGTMVEVISVPTAPSSPSSGFTGTSYKFSTSGSKSNLGSGHPVEYRFDWGDGMFSSWGSSNWGPYSQSHVWTGDGTYRVRAQARCKNHPSIESDWSSALSVSLQGKPFIRVTSPNGGENWVVGTTHTITWDRSYLNSEGMIYLFYYYDGAWHPITTLLPSANPSFNWTIPRIPEGVTSPAPSSGTRRFGFGRSQQSISIWIGNWVNGNWECSDSSDQSFRILYDAWVCKISGVDQGGATLLFDAGEFEGYGISLKWGMFEIEGTYSVDTQGLMSGTYRIRDFANPTNVLDSGNFTGSVDSSSKNLTLNLTTSNGTLTLSGIRFLNDPVIPEDWTGTLSGSASGSLTSLAIDPYQPPGDDPYSCVFEFMGAGSITGGGSINIEGYFYFNPTTTSRWRFGFGTNSGTSTNVYGIYKMTIGGVSEEGVLTGSLNTSSGTISFSMTSENGNKYTLSGNKVTP